MATRFPNYINGNWVYGSSDDSFEQRNPAKLSEVTGLWPAATVEDAQQAIQAAQTAVASWARQPPAKRAEYLKRALKNMEDRFSEIAHVLTQENGKTLSESRAEVRAALQEAEFQIHEGLRMYGRTAASRREGVFAYSVYKPLGVVSCITPWNFPFNVPNRKIIPALIAGNTCVFKPASLTPGTGRLFTQCLADADLPPGVLNFITGSGRTVGTELVTNPAIRAVSFTGSEEVGKRIHQMAAEQFTKTQLEMGGKNPAIVLADADLDLAATSVSRAAFACAGQWCTATSRAIVTKDVAEEFTKRLLEKVQQISVGDGTDPDVQMGPVCGTDQMKSIKEYIQIGLDEGAQLLAGGSPPEDESDEDCFIQPTVFGGVTPDMTIAQEEIFGPVLSVIVVEDFDEAIHVANNVRFGLASSVYTRDVNKAFRYLEENESGLLHVNLMTALKEPQLPFGGIKHSGHGLPEAGETGIAFFTEHRVAYIGYNT